MMAEAGVRAAAGAHIAVMAATANPAAIVPAVLPISTRAFPASRSLIYFGNAGSEGQFQLELNLRFAGG
jgi:hypothetical protein